MFIMRGCVLVGVPLFPRLPWDCTRASLFEAGAAENLVQYSLLAVRGCVIDVAPMLPSLL